MLVGLMHQVGDMGFKNLYTVITTLHRAQPREAEAGASVDSGGGGGRREGRQGAPAVRLPTARGVQIHPWWARAWTRACAARRTGLRVRPLPVDREFHESPPQENKTNSRNKNPTMD